MVATDIGGLRGYFGNDDVRYVPPADPVALRAALRAVAGDPATATAMARRAQASLIASELDAAGYVRRHVELSRELVALSRGASGQ